MTAKELWDFLGNEENGREEGNSRYPVKDIKINGKKVMRVVKVANSYKVMLNEHLNYSIYGTPSESLTWKISQSLTRDFGTVEGITDKSYVINSYHIDPRKKIDAFSKLLIESLYLSLCKGGAISYIEIPSMWNNHKAIMSLIKFIGEFINYGEINTKIDICYACGYEGELILSKVNSDKFSWKCPNCGNTDETLMYAIRRVCGYIGEATKGNMNFGRMDDIFNREVHVDVINRRTLMYDRMKNIYKFVA